MMPNALSEPAELRGHLIIARCATGATRTSRLPGKQPACGTATAGTAEGSPGEWQEPQTHPEE